MNASSFLTAGDVVNLSVLSSAYPFAGFSEEETRSLQSRVIFADALGVAVVSNGSICMPGFGDDHSEIADSELQGERGVFFPWNSVVSITKVLDAEKYGAAWDAHNNRDLAFYGANGHWAESNREYRAWADSQTAETFRAALAEGERFFAEEEGE
ncbi:MAG: hypothetical protein LBE05_04820 [Microbacterium sp.]|jgi:hypothetical protein|nr:hypothetical protein [Microbacterium sp.]